MRASLTSTLPSAAAFCACRTVMFCSSAMRIASLKVMMRESARDAAQRSRRSRKQQRSAAAFYSYRKAWMGLSAAAWRAG